MKLKRTAARILAVGLSLSMTAGTAFASTWYLEDGDITVTAGDSSQTVSQGSSQEIYTEDREAPVITQHDSQTATANTVTITGGGTANVILQDVNINTATGSGIDVQGTTTANITARGENTVIAQNEDSAAVHVSEGKLNLNTTEGNSVTAKNNYVSPDGDFEKNGKGAGIGSNGGENMSGDISFSGKGSLNTSSSNGAAIGSGSGGNMTGSITTGAGNVSASSSEGAAIGSGMNGDMIGSVATGSGNVAANNFSAGAGIGSGRDGDMTGSITLGSGNISIMGTAGAGIGSGMNGDMTGSFTAGSGNVNANSFQGAAIGSGQKGQMNGIVNLPAEPQLRVDSLHGTGIGSGYNGEVGPKAQLNVELGASINGREIDSLETVKGLDLGIPEDQIFELIPEEPAPTPVVPDVPAAPDASAVPAAPAASDASAVPAASADRPYWVLSGGSAVHCEETLKDGVLTLTAEAENAELHATAYGLARLQSQGVQTVVFRTLSAESRFELPEVLNRGELVLTHKGGSAELTLGGKPSDLMK